MKRTNKAIAVEYAKLKLPGGAPFWTQIIDESGTSHNLRVLVIDPRSKYHKKVIEISPSFIIKHVTKRLAAFRGLGSPYIPTAETCTILDTIVPDSMDYETHIAVRKVKQATGNNLVEYVRDRLGLTSDQLCKALAAEQIDAVAMAIYNIEVKGQGIIIGDQTGIGKGRIAAAMLRYGHIQGLKPIFISEKPNLFSDIYRDLIDIGADDGIAMEFTKEEPVLKKIKYEPWEKLSDEEKAEYDNSAEKYAEFIGDPENQYEEVFTRVKNKAFDYKKGNRLRPLIINSRGPKTNVTDKNGNLLYTGIGNAAGSKELDKIFLSGKIPDEFDVVLATYSQFNSDRRPLKRNFLSAISKGNIIVMDEAHNASGSSNTGEFLQGVLKVCKGVTFLSATFAKRPDNMPIYAMKTAMDEANLSKDELVGAIIQGGVALQEILSSQLVLEGQMLRRERSFEGIEVNYIVLTDKELEHRAISDNITHILRDIIAFQQDFIKPSIKAMDKALAKEGKEVKATGGTSRAGVDNTPYFSKVHNVISQMLFSIKADSVALRAIERLKEGKKPIIAFASTMGAFLESIETQDGREVTAGDVINTDFATVLMRGLDGVMRYTVKNHAGVGTKEVFSLDELSQDGRDEYFRIAENIRGATSGISISPIDRIISLIESAGYSVAEITGRKLEVIFDLKKASDRGDKIKKMSSETKKPGGKLKPGDIQNHFPLTSRIMPSFQQRVLVGSEEHWRTLEDLEATINVIPKSSDVLENISKVAGQTESKFAMAFLHFFYGGSDWWITEWDGKDTFFGFACLNGDWQMAEWGYVSLSELKSTGKVELDFFFTPVLMWDILRKEDADDYITDARLDQAHQSLSAVLKGAWQDYISEKNKLSGLGKTEEDAMMGVVMNRKRMNTNDAFRLFNNNEVDVLMINQSGSTGASAHAVVTDKVKLEEVKQRVMIILQAELNINTEVQKRGRINRTGQVIKPIYDYVNSAIPAEKRQMMMLQKKLKSLDANTTSNQKQSEKILSVDDFLNKYGDAIVYQYLEENPGLNLLLGDILKKEQENPDVAAIKENISLKASGRVAVLSCQEQEKFYTDIIESYKSKIQNLKNKGEFDLEVETMNLEAETLEAKIVVAGKGGKSVFAADTIIERCRVNNLRKPFAKLELTNLIEDALGELTAQDAKVELRERYKDFTDHRLNEDLEEILKRYEKHLSSITGDKQYKKLESAKDQGQYVEKRSEEILLERNMKIDQAKENSANRFDYMDGIFKSFETGKGYNYPTGSANVPCVFIKYTINKEKPNPFAPSSVSLRFAIASSIKVIDLVCSGEEGTLIQSIMGASMWLSTYTASDYVENWERHIKNTSSTKKECYIITGNILQAYAHYTGHLISYTTSDGGVKKGILMPDLWQPDARKGTNLVTIPIDKCRKIIFDINDYGQEQLKSTNGLFIEKKTWQRTWAIIVPKSKAFQDIFKDKDLIGLCTSPDDGFNMISSRMVAKFEKEQMNQVIDILQYKFSVNLQLDPQVFNLNFDVTPSKDKPVKDAQTRNAEAEFQRDKQGFECRKNPATCAPQVQTISRNDKEMSMKIAIARARARARARLLQ